MNNNLLNDGNMKDSYLDIGLANIRKLEFEKPIKEGKIFRGPKMHLIV